MVLSEFEKSIIDSINSGEVRDIKTFSEKFLTTARIKSTVKVSNGVVQIENGELIGFVDDKDGALIKTLSFLVTIKRLIHEGLLFIIRDTTLEMPRLMIRANQMGQTTFDRFYSIVKDYRYDLFIPTAEMQFFIDNKYRTRKEIIQDQENEERSTETQLDRVKRNLELRKSFELQDRSFMQTRRISYMALGLSVGISLLTVIFNYFIYTSQKEVRIINDKPAQIEIVNPEAQKTFLNNQSSQQNMKPDTVQISKK